MAVQPIQHKFIDNTCKLIIPVSEMVENVRNCDVYLGDYEFFFTADVEVKRFRSPRKFNFKDLLNIPLKFDTHTREYTMTIPVFPENKTEFIENIPDSLIHTKESSLPPTELTKLLRITPVCCLMIDGVITMIEADYPYGFSSWYRAKPGTPERFSSPCHVYLPYQHSPIDRTILRLRDEAAEFCPDRYKKDFFDLQIPEGDINPVQFKMSFTDISLSETENVILDIITAKDFTIKLDAEQTNIDCGLANILMAICYDTRSTWDNPNCDSAWVRVALSSTLCYFERFENLVDVVESFLRRCLIYPKYRSYRLGRACVDDTIEALRCGKPWIVKQLLVTYHCFNSSELKCKPLISLYIENYIQYVEKFVDSYYLFVLSRNLKNVFFDVYKKQLGLGLEAIDAELIKKLIDNVHLTGHTLMDAVAGEYSTH